MTSLAPAALIFVGVAGLTQLSNAQQRLDMVQTRLIPSIASLNMAKGYMADSRLAGYRLSVFSNLSDKTALDKAYNDARPCWRPRCRPRHAASRHAAGHVGRRAEKILRRSHRLQQQAD
jgi:hypothetical protein